MKKLLTYLLTFVRFLLLMVPGAASLMFFWPKAAAMIAILAALAVEFLFLIILSMIALVIKTGRELIEHNEEVKPAVTDMSR